jgi:hypothetical protein
MYSGLTKEGRAACWFACKAIAWGSAITLGTTAVVVVGESINASLSAWWHSPPSSPPPAIATPVYRPSLAQIPVAVAPEVLEPTSISQPVSAEIPSPAAVYVPPSPVWPEPVRVTTSENRPSQDSQPRYFSYPANFKYPTNFQSGFHPNSYPATNSQNTYRRRN